MVPAVSRRIPRVLRYSGGRLGKRRAFRLRGSHPLRPAFPRRSATLPQAFPGGSYYPRAASPRPGFGLLRFRSPLLAESLLFSFPAGTEMFQFPALAPPSRRRPPIGTGYPIRTSADRAVFAGPRGFSQLVTSFLASGSHRHPPCALLRFPFSFIYL